MTDARHTRIEPAPMPEEAAAILAALEVLGRGRTEAERPARSRWRLAGMFGHQVPPGMTLEGALWSYSSWEGDL